ncbi:Cytochrome c oxidase subunit 7C, mitochondrial [Geodia barretti]|uniref:Cytochrome c oxidase subunit 7C, mitochondrial n=1 Tax=Geodia barretti TaxID=519541 RepID=A0AA35SPQ8_GEOBA|nr:Cytochrome c oxidase subunit 7C, mitochondrial [Geodia barretti]
MASRLAMTLLSRSRTPLLRRVHFDNAPGTNMPFQTKNKLRLFFVLMGGASLGFSLPFIAVRFQLSKKSST